MVKIENPVRLDMFQEIVNVRWPSDPDAVASDGTPDGELFFLGLGISYTGVSGEIGPPETEYGPQLDAPGDLYLYYGPAQGNLRRSNSPWYTGTAVGGNLGSTTYLFALGLPSELPTNYSWDTRGQTYYDGDYLIGEEAFLLQSVSPFQQISQGIAYVPATVFTFLTSGGVTYYPHGWRWISGDTYVQEMRNYPPAGWGESGA